jgi:hypothetical protein
MRALADFTVDDFLQRVDALARVRGVGDIHEMHGFGIEFRKRYGEKEVVRSRMG